MAAEPDPRTPETFGQALRRLRTARGISLSRLAQEVHYSKGQLSKVETGAARAGPRLAHLCDVALDTGVELAALAAAEPASGRSRDGTARAAVRSGLPPAVSDFVGQDVALDRILTFLLDPGEAPTPGVGRVCVVHGMPGVGKTALAVRAAYRSEPAFPDGCLFLDLHGYTHGVPPVEPAAALDRCLRLLGVPPHAVPEHVEDRSALFRETVRGRRLLLVLDNAVDSAQLSPLIAADGTCVVLATSRRRLAGLDEATDVMVTPLSPGEAGTLFRRIAARNLAGPTAAETVDHVVHRCGLLPLAVRIAAARLRRDAALSLEELDRLLTDDSTYLLELDDGDRSAAVAFDESFDSLAAADGRLLATVALHPGPDFGVPSATAMLGTEPAAIRRGLNRLVDAHLVDHDPNGRYRLHDLVRTYAAERAGAVMPQALHWLLDYYLRSALLADAVIAPHRHRPSFEPLSDGPDAGAPPLGDPATPPISRADALRWLAEELDDLVAAVRSAADAGLDRACWQLAHALRGYFFLARDWDRWIGTHELGLAAARRLGAVDGEGYLLNGLGLAYLERGDAAAAVRYYDRALELFTAIDHRLGMASTLSNRAWAHARDDDHQAALAAHRIALDEYERVDARHAAAVTLRGIAIAEAGLGDHAEAARHLIEAARAFAEFDLPLDETMALNGLGETHLAAGDLAAAGTAFGSAAELARTSGSRFEEARARRGLARSNEDPRIVRDHLLAALVLYESLGAEEAADVRAALAAVERVLAG